MLLATVDHNATPASKRDLAQCLTAIRAWNISRGSHHRAVVSRPPFDDRFLVRFRKLVDFGIENLLERGWIDPVSPAVRAKLNCFALVLFVGHGQLAAWAVRHLLFQETKAR